MNIKWLSSSGGRKIFFFLFKIGFRFKNSFWVLSLLLIVIKEVLMGKVKIFFI